MDYRAIYNPLTKSYNKVCLKCSQDKFIESDKFYTDYSYEIDLETNEWIKFLIQAKEHNNSL